MNTLVPIVRAAVQAGLGFVLAYLAVHYGLHVSPDLQQTAVGALTAVLTGLIAKGQHLLEARFPVLGKLLHTPVYSAVISSALLADFEARIVERIKILYGAGPVQAPPAALPAPASAPAPAEPTGAPPAP